MFQHRFTKKKGFALCAAVVVLFVVGVWTAWGNKALEVNTYRISSTKLPDAFGGYRIAHISDLHNTEIADENEELLAVLRDEKPDMIAITGDIIDSRNTDIEIALMFAKEAAKIAPCYYVSGNHEARVSEYRDLKSGLEAAGVVVLEDKRLLIDRDGESIAMIGVNDPSFDTNYLFGDAAAVIRTKLSELIAENDVFTLLLSHRPELYDVYADYGIDLALSGHAHGGQVRLPFVGGLIAPNQGLFPKYDAGLYVERATNMIVSRGIGNSLFPFRVNNRPEVILIELEGLKG
ncbi:MAG: metallophosphoesterase [Oscillospiraceae bacterium]|nr:metallophosphoesterase [Oscillospiraceae bacterium]